jgi:hypothetical protein
MPAFAGGQWLTLLRLTSVRSVVRQGNSGSSATYTMRLWRTVTMDLPPSEGLRWEADAAFLVEDLDLSFAGFLGQEGFLDGRIASFKHDDGFFVIEERDSFVERMGVDPFEVYQRGAVRQ